MYENDQTNEGNADRFGRELVLGKRGTPIFPEMTPGQIALLEFLRRNRCGTFKDIHAFLGGDGTTLRRNISIMRASNVCFIRIVAQHAKERNYHKKILYELDGPGIAYLTGGSRTIERPRAVYIEHAALTAHATAHLEIGIKNCPHARLISWPEIKASKTIPKKTAESKFPFGIAYLDPDDTYVDDDGVELPKRKHANGDAPVCGIELTLEDRKKYRFLNWEADTGSESEPTVRAKIRAWLIVEKDLEYQNHFGFPKGSFFVPWLCDRLYQADRAAWLMNILSEMTGGKGSRMLTFMNYEEDGESGYVFKKPHLRVGYEPIILSQ